MIATLPIVATSLRFAFNDVEDRLTLLAADALSQGVHITLTRRLTDRLINGLGRLLEQSNAVAINAPAEMRDDIILMEHQDALYGQGRAPTPVAPGESAVVPNLPPPRLVTAVDVNLSLTTFEICMRNSQTPLVALSLDRFQVHRFIEALSQQAETASWNIIDNPAWLEPRQTEIVLN